MIHDAPDDRRGAVTGASRPLGTLGRAATTCAPGPETGRALRAAAVAMTAVLLLLIVWKVWAGSIGYDEWEHLRAAEKVSTGQVPYRDFFEHHFPALYYLIAPLVGVWPRSVTVFAAGRLVMLLLTAGCLVCIYRIGRHLYDGRTAWLGVGVWLSFATVLTAITGVRPDTPMTLAALVGLALCLGDPTPLSRRRGLAAGVAWGIAVVFSPKALLALPAGLLAAWYGAGPRRRDRTRATATLALGSGIVGVVFVAVLLATGLLDDLWKWGVRFNLALLVETRGPSAAELVDMVTMSFAGSTMARLALRTNSGAVLLAILGAVDAGVRGDRLQRGLLLIAVWLAAVTLLPRQPMIWDTFLMLAPVAILAAGAGAHLVDRFSSLRPWPATLLVLALTVQPMLTAARPLALANAAEFARLRYVLEHTPAGVPVLQGGWMFNIFLPDADYYWFNSTLRAWAAWTRLDDPRSFERVVEEERPAYVSLHENSRQERAWLLARGDYRWLEELRLFERLDLGAGASADGRTPSPAPGTPSGPSPS